MKYRPSDSNESNERRPATARARSPAGSHWGRKRFRPAATGAATAIRGSPFNPFVAVAYVRHKDAIFSGEKRCVRHRTVEDGSRLGTHWDGCDRNTVSFRQRSTRVAVCSRGGLGRGSAAPGGPARPAAEPCDRRARRPGGRRVHSADRPAGGPHVSGRRSGLAADSGSDARLARHRLSVVAVFPVRARERNSADQVALFIHDGRISFRTVVGKFVCCSASLASGIALGREGPVGPDRRRARFRHRAASGAQPGTGEGAGSGRGCRRARRRLQHADRGRAVLARRDHGRSARAGARLRRAELGHVLDGAAPGARRRSALPRRRLSPGESGRVRVYAVLGVVGGLGLGLLRQAAARTPAWFAPASAVERLVSAGRSAD